MSKKATFIHADGTATTVYAPFGGDIKVNIEKGVACATATNILGTTVKTVCMGTPNPVGQKTSSGGSSGNGGCGCP